MKTEPNILIGKGKHHMQNNYIKYFERIMVYLLNKENPIFLKIVCTVQTAEIRFSLF